MFVVANVVSFLLLDRTSRRVNILCNGLFAAYVICLIWMTPLIEWLCGNKQEWLVDAQCSSIPFFEPALNVMARVALPLSIMLPFVLPHLVLGILNTIRALQRWLRRQVQQDS